MHTSEIYVSLFDYCPEGKIPLQHGNISVFGRERVNERDAVQSRLSWSLVCHWFSSPSDCAPDPCFRRPAGAPGPAAHPDPAAAGVSRGPSAAAVHRLVPRPDRQTVLEP